jgi:phospholipid/cholesterol/gamma-HCH transport system substrate-binding protein
MIAQNEAKVGRLVTDLTTFSNTLKSASPELKNVISNFNAISDTLAKANIAGVIYNANKTISDIDIMVRKVNDGKGDIGQLMNNDTLYKNLEAATNNLNLLLKDIKQNPGRYVQVSVFGKKDK